MTPDEVMEAFRALDGKAKDGVIGALLSKLTDRERAFVDSYCESLDSPSASKAAGYRSAAQGWRMLRGGPYADVRLAVDAKLAEREAVSALRAEYVREYILDVLELCPTDFFHAAEDGSWCVYPEEFAQLPHRVRRLVERVDVRFVNGRRTYRVEFVSKNAALSMAAKFTLVQQLEAAVARIPWDEVCAAPKDEVRSRVEAAELRALTFERERSSELPADPSPR